MAICQECEKPKKSVVFYDEYSKELCAQCFIFYREHPVHDLPPNGEIHYDELGRPICHICGRAFNKVLNHAYQKHEITANDYKKRFGLMSSKGICSQRTVEKLRIKVEENYDIVVKQNLLKNGERTRFKDGHKGSRPRAKLREQSLKILRENMAKINEKR